jgi:hypothetical protein
MSRVCNKYLNSYDDSVDHISLVENVYLIPFCFVCHADRDELITFKTSIRTYLYRLRKLSFVLNLPGETILEKDDLYWFDLDHHGVQYEIDTNETNSIMFLYTLPYLLNSQRQVHNNTFARRSQIERKINYIQWIVDDDPLSIDTSLVYLQNVHSLTWFYNIQVNSIHVEIEIFKDFIYLGNNSKSTSMVLSTSSPTLCCAQFRTESIQV